jgi:protein-S-isoprenylcysteine O-methyltransferase Ste14
MLAWSKNNMSKVNLKAFGGLASLLATLCIFLFLPAWTVSYPQAWIFLAAFGIPTVAITLYLAKKDPKLLERRVSGGAAAEKEKSQKIIQLIAQIAFISVFVVSALDYRFNWSNLTFSVVILGDALVVLGLLFVFLVFKENSFTSAIIEVGAEQKVVSTGPYALVRHPMYAGAFIMLIGTSLALGSLWSLISVFFLILVIVWRLIEEERFLEKNLSGYSEYRQKVKYRLLPFIW